jgi:outer membrane protein assembly factor BamB
MRTLAALLACLLLAAAGGTGKKMTTSIYSTKFASPRLDSFVPVASPAKGTIAWTQELAGPLAGRPDLLILGERVLVNGATAFALYAPDGKLLWTQAKRANGLAVVAGDRVYFDTPGLSLEAVDASGARVLKDAPFPGLAAANIFVLMLWPRERDFVAALYKPDPQYDEEDRSGAGTQPLVYGRRAEYGDAVSDWGTKLPGVMSLPALFLPEENRWLVGQKAITSVDVETKEARTIPVPVAEPKSWSAAADGTLVVIGRDAKERKEITAIDLEGRERWHWADRDDDDAWVDGQPPIQAPRGRVLLLTSHRVLAVEKGKTLWQFDLAEEAKRREQPFERPSFGTALGDGALLLAAGATLRRINSSGAVTFTVKLPGAITAPPVVDPAGTIYAATATQLVQIK